MDIKKATNMMGVGKDKVDQNKQGDRERASVECSSSIVSRGGGGGSGIRGRKGSRGVRGNRGGRGSRGVSTIGPAKFEPRDIMQVINSLF